MPRPGLQAEYTEWGQSQTKQTELIADVYVQFYTNRERGNYTRTECHINNPIAYNEIG